MCYYSTLLVFQCFLLQIILSLPPPSFFFSTIALGRDHKLIADGNLYFKILTVTIFEIKINETFFEIILSCVKSNEDYTNMCLFVIYTAPSGMTTKSNRLYFPRWEVVIFQVQDDLTYRRWLIAWALLYPSLKMVWASCDTEPAVHILDSLTYKEAMWKHDRTVLCILLCTLFHISTFSTNILSKRSMKDRVFYGLNPNLSVLCKMANNCLSS